MDRGNMRGHTGAVFSNKLANSVIITAPAVRCQKFFCDACSPVLFGMQNFHSQHTGDRSSEGGSADADSGPVARLSLVLAINFHC